MAHIWTKEEEEYLMKHYSSRMPMAEKEKIAEHLNVTIESLRHKFRDLSFKPRKDNCKRCGCLYNRTNHRHRYCDKCKAIVDHEARIRKTVIKDTESEEDKKNKALIATKQFVCHQCGETKSGTEFVYDPRMTNLVRNECKACLSSRNKRNREKRISEGRDW